jgi:hypothetical protein
MILISKAVNLAINETMKLTSCQFGKALLLKARLGWIPSLFNG